jgi:hypothetical protein
VIDKKEQDWNWKRGFDVYLESLIIAFVVQ